jgi:hypothetical protein
MYTEPKPNIDMTGVGVDIAAHLTALTEERWAVALADGWTAVLVGATGVRIHLGQRSKKGSVTASMDSVRGLDGTYFPYSDADKVADIHMSDRKTPSQMARDIAGRLLPILRQKWAIAVRQRDEHNDRLAGTKALTKELAVLLHDEPAAHSPTTFTGGQPGKGYVRGQVNGPDSVTLDIRGASADQARKILQILVDG